MGVPRSPLAAQVSVDQLELVLTPARAAQRVASFNVLNSSDTVAAATVYVGDWDRSEQGEHRFYAAGTLPRSCASRLRVFPTEVRIAPQSAQPIRVTFDGDSVDAECWAMVFVEGARPAVQNTGRQIVYVVRAGVKVYAQPPAVVTDAAIEDMQLVAQAGSATRRDLVVAVRNTGSTHFLARGTVEIRRPDNSVVSSTAIENIALLPGAMRRLVTEVAPLPAGRYLALVLVDYGGSEVAAAQLEFEAP